MATTRVRWASARGAMLIQVGVALLAAMSMTAYVVDYGVFWVARTQAQNAADAAAMAGATSLVFDNPESLIVAKATAKMAAIAVAAQHTVWGRQVTLPANKVNFPPCPDLSMMCVQVDVELTDTSAIATFLAGIVGVNDQETRARAIAQAMAGDTVLVR